MNKTDKILISVIIFIALSFIGYVICSRQNAVPLKITGTDSLHNSDMVTVEISGAVKKPGKYKINADSKIFDAIKSAGGIKENADLSKIKIEEIISKDTSLYIPYSERDTEDATAQYKFSKKILCNINTAGIERLSSVNGIGEKTAQNIIDYRSENGNFKSVEDIKKVNGIGEKLFEKIKDYITVGENSK